MPNLLAMSFEGPLAPSLNLRCLTPGAKLPDGWGIGFYPGGEPSASVLKEPAPAEGSIRSELVKAWQHLESPLFVCHIRSAMWGSASDANTQPFSRSWGRRDWLFGHAGSLRDRLPKNDFGTFQPVGSTDTEEIFCGLLNLLAARGWRSIGDSELPVIQNYFHGLNAMGPMSVTLTDGEDLLIYADEEGQPLLHLWKLFPPSPWGAFGDVDLTIDLGQRGQSGRKGVVVVSGILDPLPLGRNESRVLSPGEMVVVRQGAIRAELPPIGRANDLPNMAVRHTRMPPSRQPVRRIVTHHRTAYHYETLVERSTHSLRLTPVHDRLQTVIDCDIRLSVEGRHFDYEDAFGNRVRRAFLDTPFKDLVIEARSTVEVRETDPLVVPPFAVRPKIPLVWMPWQLHMLQPYLLPPELSDSELQDLTRYAMTFVQRNDFDLLDTLLDLNSTMFEEYKYRQGSTTLETNAFEVYERREGVCQDFANLFICLARLMGVPARYACGYVLPGSQTRVGDSEASHAWAQVYLPDIGWRGFDPTNGKTTQTEHVRVAVGRSYRDATPTAGTLYVGGGPGTLDVQVSVKEIE